MTLNSKNMFPSVTWGKHRISRLLIGHNLFKGSSHFSAQLSQEMRAWHSDAERILETLRRCEACGINTAQFGDPEMHNILRTYQSEGGTMQWIATFYGNSEGNLGFGRTVGMQEELKQILEVEPKPIGIQHFGERTDRLYFEGRLELVREATKWFRDTGLLVGVCTHLPEVAEEIMSHDWDIDFFQLSFYTAYAGTRRRRINRTEEIFDDSDRERMARLVPHLAKPCMVFKVLGAGRKCGCSQDVEAALRYAYQNIKDCDVVCVGMWQKYQDQVGQNAEFVRQILKRSDHNQNLGRIPPLGGYNM